MQRLAIPSMLAILADLIDRRRVPPGGYEPTELLAVVVSSDSACPDCIRRNPSADIGTRRLIVEAVEAPTAEGTASKYYVAQRGVPMFVE